MSDFRFPDETRAFLEGIAANNEKAWFDANRPLYEAGYVAAGRAFVSAMGPRASEMPGACADAQRKGSALIIREAKDVLYQILALHPRNTTNHSRPTGTDPLVPGPRL